MKRYKNLLTLALLSLILSVKAQMPVLKVQQENAEQSVMMKKLDIDVQITGNIATTVMTMTFYNNANKILEGELSFPMPEGVTVSKYALDINGKMRAAVPVEKAKATAVFESIERRRVDPGLLEKVEGNNFRTRIYPLPAKGSRTVIIGYEQELAFVNDKALSYHLPLAYQQAVEDFSLKATVYESVLKPQMQEQPDGSFDFKTNGNVYVAEIHKKDFLPKRGLTINLPKRSDLPEIQLQKASAGYYFLINVFPKSPSKPRIWSNQIGLIWDASLSGMQHDRQKEMQLLDAIVKQKRNLTIQLGLLNNGFRNAGTFRIKNGDWTELKNKLNQVVYDGGTNFSSIDDKSLFADEYLFFTDGLSTFGKNTIALTKPVHCINSSLKADYSTLKYISLKSGGQFVNLNNLSAKDAFKQLSEQQLQFLGIKNGSDLRQTYPAMRVNVNGNFSLAGILNELNTEFILQFGYGNEVVTEQKLRLNATEHALASIDVSRIWAQKKIAEMDIQYEEHKQDISHLSKQFGIVTRNTSLIVLENLDDYLRYDIVPPAELRGAYEAALKVRRNSLLEQKTNLMNAAVAMTKELKTWWDTDFNYKETSKVKEEYPVPERATEDIVSIPRMAETARRETENRQAVRRPAPAAERLQDAKQGQALHEIVVVGYAAQAKRELTGSAVTLNNALAGRVAGAVVRERGNTEARPQPKIVVQKFKSDKEYIKSLTGTPDSAYAAYLKLRPDYISTPMFYFDVANWFYEQKDSVRALTILSNIADLDLENADLYKTLAYKLKQTKNYKEEIFVTEKVLQWRPMDAQSYRDYALALADDGQYQKALDNLYSVLTNDYNAQISDRDHGIEEIIISEINNLIARHGKELNTRQIDKRLIQSLPVDVRVVLNWNKNDTDIDLWLTDPTGEKGYYGNPKTKIGGRISDDFISGYGPEQFMIKKAIKGKYKIEVNYYGDQQINISGPTTVTAEIYTRYATGKQQREVIVLPMSASNKTGNLVGEFYF
ncbi:VIT domain-containing protein [Pedobacter rhizosphaerae]|uniref:Tetratricopeptide repeat-containing protein n=1 Tax=Pedobacter rhizosphaerae TaxID=390241 RepID=A0A1H9ISN5_9SPHI|nr:VIT domain-containing protein [Pedobacter rhizosphaerae]SEQ77528.1 Tetratricopeptide repeat-containing protein [Pedobacter rhizosphaerae]